MIIKRLKDPDEIDLLFRLQKGDLHAFDIIYTKFHSALCFFASRLTSDDFVAGEIAQDVLYKLWLKHKDFDSLSSIKAFLYISTKHASMNVIDKERRKSKHNLALVQQGEDLDDPVINEIRYAEIVRQIAQEIVNLPEQCGKIIKMIYENEMKPQEIADQRHISVNTVYSQKLRGLNILRQKLSGREFNFLITAIEPKRIQLANDCGFDLVTGYNYHEAGYSKGKMSLPIDNSLITGSEHIWNDFKNYTLPLIPVVTANWDPRPWPAQYKTTPSYTGYGMQSVEKSVKSVKKFMAQNPNIITMERIALIYAWNEYGEGGWLTPSIPLKDSLLLGVKKGLTN